MVKYGIYWNSRSYYDDTEIEELTLYTKEELISYMIQRYNDYHDEIDEAYENNIFKIDSRHLDNLKNENYKEIYNSGIPIYTTEEKDLNKLLDGFNEGMVNCDGEDVGYYKIFTIGSRSIPRKSRSPKIKKVQKIEVEVDQVVEVDQELEVYQEKVEVQKVKKVQKVEVEVDQVVKVYQELEEVEVETENI